MAGGEEGRQGVLKAIKFSKRTDGGQTSGFADKWAAPPPFLTHPIVRPGITTHKLVDTLLTLNRGFCSHGLILCTISAICMLYAPRGPLEAPITASSHGTLITCVQALVG
ncbi:hypothetical protein J6590_019698 [Homalodisca vitripennis]|nr:hypothetical protein J6590_019698 [Homalodisca vitripennis]